MKNKLALFSCVMLPLLIWHFPSWGDTNTDDYTLLFQSAWRNGFDSRLGFQEPRTDSISIVTIPQVGGAVLKTSMFRSDDFSHVANGTPRVEVLFSNVAHFAIDYEYELRWSTIIPANYQFDSQQPEIITQIHQSDYHIGPPPFSLMLSDQQYEVDVRGAAGLPSKILKFGSPSVDKGRVVSWLLRYRPDDSGGSAVTDLYKDDSLVVSTPGIPNAYPGEKNGYLKMGVYKWWWVTRPSDVTERTMYYGDVEIKARRSNPNLELVWGDPQMSVFGSTYDPKYAVDWQNGPGTVLETHANNPSDISVVSDPVRSGSKAIRASLSPNEDFSSTVDKVPTAQLSFQNALVFTEGKDYLIRWSTFIPSAALPSDSSQVIAVVQQGTSNDSPLLALSISGADYTFAEGGGNPMKAQPLFTLCCSTADQAKWVNWAMRYVPDATGQHSSTQLWKDGTLVYASQGAPNAFADASHFRIGLSLAQSNSKTLKTPVTVFFGPVSIGQR